MQNEPIFITRYAPEVSRLPISLVQIKCKKNKQCKGNLECCCLRKATFLTYIKETTLCLAELIVSFALSSLLSLQLDGVLALKAWNFQRRSTFGSSCWQCSTFQGNLLISNQTGNFFRPRWCRLCLSSAATCRALVLNQLLSPSPRRVAQQEDLNLSFFFQPILILCFMDSIFPWGYSSKLKLKAGCFVCALQHYTLWQTFW